jgi:methionyl-tRNA formyltransferase
MLLSAIELIAKGHEPVLVATAPAAPEYGVEEEDFAGLAARLGAEFYTTSSGKPAGLLHALRDAKPDIAISFNWPSLIGAETIAVVPHGILNAHPGDLPRFRGNACPNWAILAGERQVVLTVHAMNGELDAGPIHVRAAMPLEETTYIGDVYKWLADTMPGLFLRAMSSIENGTARPVDQPQDPALSLRCFPRIPEDSLIDWSADAESISRLVRASTEPFSGAYTFLGAERLTVWRMRKDVLRFRWLGRPGQVAHRDKTSGEVSVLTGKDAIVLQEVEYAGRRVRPADLIESTRARLGLGLEGEVRALRARLQTLEDHVNRLKAAPVDPVEL